MKKKSTPCTQKSRGNRTRLAPSSEMLAQIFRPFLLLPRPMLDYLSRCSRIDVWKGGSVIFREKRDSANSFFVVTGRVVLSKTAHSGSDFIVDIITPGLPFGLIDSLQDVPYSLSARAHTIAQVLSIPREPLASLLTEYPMVYREVMHIVADRWREGLSFSVALAHDCVERRVALVLMRLIEKFSVKNSDRPRIEITRLELSELAGCAPETASRVAKAMERAGCISLIEQGVISVANRNSLRKLAEG